MPLRHGGGPPPRWLALCAGPFMIIAGLLGAAGIASDGPITLGDAVGLALALVLAAAGVALTIDTFTGKT